ncbi:MAG TPA: ATP-binding protein [Nitrospiraceae bacterium]|nr:ATP-binding protein [Nitrospiraceae bacterium]
MNRFLAQLWPSLTATATLGLVAAIFFIDLSTPVGLAFWVLYLFPLWLASRLFRHHPIFLKCVGGLCIALIMAGLFLPQAGLGNWMSIANRMLWVAVVLTVTVLLVRAIRRERMLEEREERLTLALDGAQLGTWEINLLTGRMSASSRMNAMVGAPNEFVGRHVDDWRTRVHPDDCLRLQREIADAMERLTTFETEFRVVWPDGAVRWLLPKGKIVRDAEKRPIRAAGVAMDITARHQAEEERAQLLHEAERREQALREKQAQLVQSAKLASLGELTTGVAHELNNPLNNINLILGNLIDQVHDEPVQHESFLLPLKLAMAQVLKASTIINHLRAFGRMAPMEREPVFVNEVLKSAVDLMQEQLRLRAIELTASWSPANPVVLGNRIQLEQVFLNLLTNARDAVESSPKKSIVLSSAVHEGMIEITFQDSGTGIPVEHQGRIFDPFFTTKPVGEGTGLGLSISYGIIKEHQGQISVQSHPSAGATFTIHLPLLNRVSDEAAELDLFTPGSGWGSIGDGFKSLADRSKAPAAGHHGL